MKRRYNLSRKRIFACAGILTVMFMIILPVNIHANAFTDMIWGAVSAIPKLLADGLISFCESLNGNLDKLIFNNVNGQVVSDFNLTILRNNSISPAIFSVYRVVQIIGTCVLACLGLCITVAFVRAAHNPQRKAILKSRLIKLILAIVLLTSIPVLIDIMLTINYVITDTFRSLLADFVESFDSSKPLLTETFKVLADKNEGSQEFIYSIMYLMTGFLNIWLVVYYMIRDLAISFLLMLSPLIVAVLPYKSDLLLKWIKEMWSNIFTQGIQAFILFIIMIISTGIGDGDLYSSVFALVSFCMFIPLTGMIKKLFGLEGEIGAAKSNAGLGLAIGAISLAGMTAKSGMQGFNDVKTGINNINDLKAERKNIEKGNFDEQLPNTNSNMRVDRGASSQNDLDRPKSIENINARIANERKEMFKKATGKLGGAYMGGMMALGSGVYGNPMASIMASRVGMEVGENLGEGVGALAYKGGQEINELTQNAMYGRGIRPEHTDITNGNLSWRPANFTHNIRNMYGNLQSNIDSMKEEFSEGLGGYTADLLKGNDFENRNELIRSKQEKLTGLDSDPIKYTNKDEYTREMDARLHKQKLMREGNIEGAYRSYANKSASKVNKPALNELQTSSLENGGSSNAMLYTDKNNSILFTQNADSGEREILGMWEGNPSIETPVIENIDFNQDKEITISENMKSDFKEQAVKNIQPIYGQDITIERIEQINANNNPSRDEIQIRNAYEKEYTGMINNHIDRVTEFRKQTGLNCINIGDHTNYNANEFVVPISNISLTKESEDMVPKQRYIAERLNNSKVEVSGQKEEFIKSQLELAMLVDYKQGLENMINADGPAVHEIYTDHSQLN